MAISVADNFSYKGAKPLDARIQYATVANMKSATTSDLYDGCLAYVTETKKNYQYDSTNSVDPTTGKWRELQTGGGGGASDLSDLGDVTISSPANNQVLKYNSTTEKWENADGGGSGGGHTIEDEGVALTQRDTLNFVDFDLEDDDTNEKTVVQSHELTQEEFAEIFSTLPTMLDKSSLSSDATNFSLSEKIIGTWIDGKPLYQKTLTGTYNNSQNVDISVADLDIESIMFDLSASFRIQSDNNRLYVGYFFDSSDKCQCYYNKASNCVRLQKGGAGTAYVTIRYTKTSDSALASGEKIVGQWIDGKPIYQKTLEFNPRLQVSYNSFSDTNVSASNVKQVIDAHGYDANGTTFDLIAHTYGQGTASSTFAFQTTRNGADIYIVYATLQYTKTTD